MLAKMLTFTLWIGKPRKKIKKKSGGRKLMLEFGCGGTKSGVDVNHSDFDGRAFWGGNFVPGSPDTDENGHGTIIAGIAAGTSFGVAKKANIISVKVGTTLSFHSCMLTFVFHSA